MAKPLTSKFQGIICLELHYNQFFRFVTMCIRSPPVKFCCESKQGCWWRVLCTSSEVLVLYSEYTFISYAAVCTKKQNFHVPNKFHLHFELCLGKEIPVDVKFQYWWVHFDFFKIPSGVLCNSSGCLPSCVEEWLDHCWHHCWVTGYIVMKDTDHAVSHHNPATRLQGQHFLQWSPDWGS